MTIVTAFIVGLLATCTIVLLIIILALLVCVVLSLLVFARAIARGGLLTQKPSLSQVFKGNRNEASLSR